MAQLTGTENLSLFLSWHSRLPFSSAQILLCITSIGQYLWALSIWVSLFQMQQDSLILTVWALTGTTGCFLVTDYAVSHGAHNPIWTKLCLALWCRHRGLRPSPATGALCSCRRSTALATPETMGVSSVSLFSLK